MLNEKAQAILDYWFGHAETAVTPSEHRWQVWFGKDPNIDQEIKDHFEADFQLAVKGDYQSWANEPRGNLALIILLDQFSRVIYRGFARSFLQDDAALKQCLQGIEQQHDHFLSLIERTFFYMPLMHAESLEMQTLSVRAYQMLAALAFQETRSTYENFLVYAARHYEVIEKFGRFPQRNEVLGRPSTEAELEFLKNAKNLF